MLCCIVVIVPFAGGGDAGHHGAAGHVQPAGAAPRGAPPPRAGRAAAAGPGRARPADAPPGGRPAPQHLPGRHAGKATRGPAPCRGPRTCSRTSRGGTRQPASILSRTPQSDKCHAETSKLHQSQWLERCTAYAFGQPPWLAIRIAAAEAHTARWQRRHVHQFMQDSELCIAAGKHQHADGEPE